VQLVPKVVLRVQVVQRVAPVAVLPAARVQLEVRRVARVPTQVPRVSLAEPLATQVATQTLEARKAAGSPVRLGNRAAEVVVATAP
jgi:hypothetical protein